MSVLESLQTTDLKPSVIKWQGLSEDERIEVSGFTEFSEDDQLFLMWLGHQVSSHAIINKMSENNLVIQL